MNPPSTPAVKDSKTSAAPLPARSDFPHFLAIPTRWMDNDVYKDYQLYRKLKNVALWESADGNFSAYVSCDRPPAQVKAAKAASIRTAKQGKITLLICDYRDGLAFTWRTRAQCKLEAGADCAANPAACKANCE